MEMKNQNNIEHQYLKLLKDILDNGVEKQDRTGTGTISVFGRQIRHDMKLGFPLLTTKKMYWKGIVTELLWFLRGDTNIKFLVDNDCHIWDNDAYKYYKRVFPYDNPKPLSQEDFIERIKTDDVFAKHWGDLGPVYGKQWREWQTPWIVNEDSRGNRCVGTRGIDQIANSINLLKTDPDSRRNRVNAWNVGELDQMTLPPCHTDFQFYTRELSSQERMDVYNKSNWNKDIFPSDVSGWNRLLDTYHIPKRAISLMWSQRSCDVPLGIPFNIASYALLLELLAKMTNMVPDELIGNLGDTHIYHNQVDGIKEQLTREPYELPKLNINTEWWPTESGECGEGPIDAQAVLEGFSNDNFCKCLIEEDIQLGNYKYHPTIKMPLSN
jgi:thymidylate synthase